MAEARIPRRRGGLCGFLLVLLGLWGGLIPLVGPYFHFGYSPDKAWSYSSGRLYLSILPGAVTLVAGLIVMSTRSRTAGVFGGFLAAAAGAWFAVGGLIMAALHQTSVTPGQPIGLAATAAAPTWRVTGEELGLFYGLGVVVVFFGALAIGRFSMLGAREALRAREAAETDADLTPATQQFPQVPGGGDTTDTGGFSTGHDLFEPRPQAEPSGQAEAGPAEPGQAEPLPRRPGPQLPEGSQQLPADSETVTTTREPTN